MRALVTGATGFVGSAVVRALLAEGVEVRCLVRPADALGTSRRNLEGLPVELCEGDLADPVALAGVLRDCQQLYHVAALYSTRPEDAAAMVRVNVDGTRALLTAAAEAGLRAIVHTSTIGTIGQPAEARLATEEDRFTQLESASPYARSKLEGERVALELAAGGAPVVVVNPCAPVGPRDYKPSSTGARILAYLAGRTPSFVAGGINFVAVRDVAAGHLLAARAGQRGRRYILGNAAGNLTLSDFEALMERVSGVPRPAGVRPTTTAPWRALLGRLRQSLRGVGGAQQQGYRPSALTADPSRAIRELGLPQTPLELAFGEAVAWFRENGYTEA